MYWPQKRSSFGQTDSRRAAIGSFPGAKKEWTGDTAPVGLDSPGTQQEQRVGSSSKDWQVPRAGIEGQWMPLQDSHMRHSCGCVDRFRRDLHTRATAVSSALSIASAVREVNWREVDMAPEGQAVPPRGGRGGHGSLKSIASHWQFPVAFNTVTSLLRPTGEQPGIFALCLGRGHSQDFERLIGRMSAPHHPPRTNQAKISPSYHGSHLPLERLGGDLCYLSELQSHILTAMSHERRIIEPATSPRVAFLSVGTRRRQICNWITSCLPCLRSAVVSAGFCLRVHPSATQVAAVPFRHTTFASITSLIMACPFRQNIVGPRNSISNG